jgi:serine/threonine-protein kinase RsbW
MSEEAPISFVNDLAEIERLSRVIDEFARRHRLPAHVAFDLQLAANEIFTNVILHGFTDDRRHEIVLRLMAGPDEVAVEIEDDGRPFDPSSVPPPRLDQPLAERPVGGLGVHLARRVTDAMEYRRQAERNVVRMRKRLA